MKTSVSLVACLFWGAVFGAHSTPCSAQTESGVVSGSGSVFLRGPGLVTFIPVTGAPYSAEQESEHKQRLSDGTHIDQTRELSKTYRDSEGRTRMERLQFLGLSNAPTTAGGPRWIRIQDPLTGYSYTLDVRKRIAHRVAMRVQYDKPVTDSSQAKKFEAAQSAKGEAPPPREVAHPETTSDPGRAPGYRNDRRSPGGGNADHHHDGRRS